MILLSLSCLAVGAIVFRLVSAKMVNIPAIVMNLIVVVIASATVVFSFVEVRICHCRGSDCSRYCS